jgi:uncharacterized membrane protein YkvA (DUF1232 family)
MKVMYIFGVIIGVIYIINPGAGIIEFIPDNMPIIGNLDEAAAVILILKCLRELGYDITRRKKKEL